MRKSSSNFIIILDNLYFEFLVTRTESNLFILWQRGWERFHCGIYIPLSDDKHRKVRDSSKKRTGNPRQIQSKNFFLMVGNFSFGLVSD